MSKKLAPRLTTDKKSKIVELSKAGKTAPQIAEALKIKEHQVYNCLRKSKKGKKRVATNAVTGMTSQAIRAKLSEAKKMVSQLAKILKAVVKEEKKFLKIKA